MKQIKAKGIEVVIYEPVMKESEFKKISDIIVANRLEDSIMNIVDKVYTRNIFNSDS